MSCKYGLVADVRLDEGGGVALGQLTGDEHALDLAGAFPDPLDAQLAVEAFGHVLAHVSAATEDLDGPVGDAARHLRTVELGHRALRVRHLQVGTAVDAARGLVGHRPGGEQLGQAVREHPGHQPVLDDRLAARAAGPGERGHLPVSRSAAPRQRAATISRSNRNHSYANVIPSPSAPTRFAAGTATSSKATIGWWWLIVCA